MKGVGLTGILLVMLLAPLATCEAVSQHTFDRYHVILERKPFGEPPPEPPPPVRTEPERPAEPPFVKDYRLVAISQTRWGLAVGLVYVKENPPANYYLEIGDATAENVVLLDADYDEQGALLFKDGEEYWIFLDGRTMDGDGRSLGAGDGSASRPAARQDSEAARQAALSYRERLQRRREAVRHRKVEPPELTGKELEAHLRELNLDLIRKAARGESAGPPLPIPLTPEEDALLVEEGVLPPME